MKSICNGRSSGLPLPQIMHGGGGPIIGLSFTPFRKLQPCTETKLTCILHNMCICHVTGGVVVSVSPWEADRYPYSYWLMLIHSSSWKQIQRLWTTKLNCILLNMCICHFTSGVVVSVLPWETVRYPSSSWLTLIHSSRWNQTQWLWTGNRTGTNTPPAIPYLSIFDHIVPFNCLPSQL